jgi:hypothetical protein
MSPEPRRRRVVIPWSDVLITIASIGLAFIVGALLMIFSDTAVRSNFAYFFARPSDALIASWEKISSAYAALIKGALGGYGPMTETTAQAAPLICAGLGVGLAFRAGLFNIGAQGQAILGALVAAYIGFTWHLPPGIHLLLAILGGLLGGAFWGGIVGWLKAKTGAHEVIVTIMMNYIAVGLLAYLLTTGAFQRPGRTDPISPIVDWNATMPRLEGGQLHLGFLLALLAAVAVWWILDRSTTGFEPTCCRNRRDERGPNDDHHHVPGGCTGGARGCSGGFRPKRLGTARAAFTRDRGVDWLRRNHRRPTRPVQATRHRTGRLAVRRAACRRSGDAEHCPDAAHPDNGAAGTDCALRRGARARYQDRAVPQASQDSGVWSGP